MSESNITINKIKEIIVDINPQDVLKDAKEYGLLVNSIEDFRNQADNYVFIEKLAQKYGDVAARYCAISGAGAGIGGVATAVALAGADLTNMAAQLYRLNQKIAVLHGFDPNNDLHQEKVISIYLMALGIDAASSSVIRAAVVKAAIENTAAKGPASSVAIKLILLAAKGMGLKQVTKATAAKVVPFIGAVFGGGLNYYFAKKSAEKIILSYKSDYFDRWQSENRSAKS